MPGHELDHREKAVDAGAGEGFTELLGRRFYRIAGYDQMPAFFMTVVGSGDPWLFVSSTGGLTAGRVRPDTALFPYYTDDKVSESAGRTGGLSLIRVVPIAGEPLIWEPFSPAIRSGGEMARTIYKDPLGTTLIFEESRADLGLTLRVSWQTASRFGIVRTCTLSSVGDKPQDIELVDGLVNLLPAGVDVAVQNRLSNLLDAYKRAEIDEQTGLGMFTLSSRLTDLAEPSESLHANVAWQVGLGPVDHLVSTRQLEWFKSDGSLVAEHDVRGLRGAYLVHAHLSLAPGEQRAWSIVGDVEQDVADVIALRDLLTRPEELALLLEADVRTSRSELERIVASADGLQVTGEELATAHHAANVLFNVMRGGVPTDGYRVDSGDFRSFVEQRSPATLGRCVGLLAGLPATLTSSELVEAARASRDPDLIRLGMEYLPLTFSRRHGDPSRPWNTFEIALRDAHGNPRLSFEGNWRDIFQNWEALAWSFPEYLESMISVFLDATTADGYNPYRISRAGIDWEVPEPHNPWANIGYWSDHQIIYLLKLLETSVRFHPGRLEELTGTEVFTHADVPYRIASYAETLKDPHNTISFDEDHAARIAERIEQNGADGRLVHGPNGDLVRVTLAEKLLLLLLAKVVNLVPDGGIWMNTQRPEWNDANNALVGRGLSVVTLAQVRRYVEFAQDLLTQDVRVTEELADLMDGVTGALEAHRRHLRGGFSDSSRRGFMDDLGAVGGAYRERVYAGFSGRHADVSGDRVQTLLALVRSYVDSTLAANRRQDSLYHSYNILDLADGDAAIRRLPEMLEGQVAMLGSGQLDAQESLALLAGLRSSKLYRADQHSYMLYPDKDLAGFLDRNRIPGVRATRCALISALVRAGDRSLVVRDVHGDLHFASPIRNVRDVEAILDRMAGEPDLAALVETDFGEVLSIFEEVFNHSEFTGRSGSFFAYEGLGSIYWHMVSKLLLSVQETLERAVADGESSATVQALTAAYEDVRVGLGYAKPAAVYGAFPIDPYSHTPAGHGARQPGMTGQVKEEVLTRLGELGLRVQDGQIVFAPNQLRASEWLAVPVTFEFIDVLGRPRQVELSAGCLAFTFCQVPVVYHRAESLSVQVHLAEGTVVDCSGARIGVDLSASIFERRGTVARIEVRIPAAP